MAGTVQEETLGVALEAMGLSKLSDIQKVERLSDDDQCRIYKVYVDGRALLVRSSSKDGCAAAHFYATTAARCLPNFRPKVLGYDVERGILVEEWLDPGEYKSLAHQLWHEPTSDGWSTSFSADEFRGVDFESTLSDAGQKIGRIHSATRGLAPFAGGVRPLTRQDKPFEILLRAAKLHPHVANRLGAVAEQSERGETVLLHGCLSPGSVLFNQDMFSEDHVAIISSHHSASGDPAVDLAHMMAHLFVAAVRGGSSILVTSARGFQAGYAQTIEGLDKLAIMYRAGPLTVAFMLGLLEDPQISGLLDDRAKQDILDFSQWWLGRRDYTLGQVGYALWDAVDLGVIDWREKFKSLPRAND